MIKRQLFDYDVTCVIMGGGAGTRLKPLTSQRAKPAVPLGGKFRLIDIPISNCINSGLNRIYVLTQFNSAPLHRHISQSYHFHRFSRGFVEILAAQQSPNYGVKDDAWYQGTADAVRKNLPRIQEAGGQEVLILSGDQIYQMDFCEILGTHRGSREAQSSTLSKAPSAQPLADVTLGAVVVDKERARSFGILRVDSEGNVLDFVEKPGDDDSKFEGLEVGEELLAEFGMTADSGPWYLANMGIYVFQIDVLSAALDNDFMDFGGEVLPSLLGKAKFRAHLFDGYWEDIGTIKSFHDANIDLASALPKFDFYDQERPIYTRARLLPASKVNRANVTASLVSDGCLVDDATISQSILGIRSVVRRGAHLESTYLMGADHYESDEDRAANRQAGRPDIGIGESAHVRNAIVDKNSRVGNGVRLVNKQGIESGESSDGLVYVREGIVVVPRDAIIPDGYEF